MATWLGSCGQWLHGECLLLPPPGRLPPETVTAHISRLKSHATSFIVCINYLEFFSTRLVSSPCPHLFIDSAMYLEQYGFMGIYFMLWVISQYCLNCFIALIIPTLAGLFKIFQSFRWLCVSLTPPPHCGWALLVCWFSGAFSYFLSPPGAPGSSSVFLPLC